MQTINLQVNEVSDVHVHCSLFMNRTCLGTLIFDIREYQIFRSALSSGIQQTQGHLINNSNAKVYKKWAHRKLYNKGEV